MAYKPGDKSLSYMRGMVAKAYLRQLWGTGLNKWIYAVAQAKRTGSDLNIVCALDSLTAGAGGSSYIDFFRPLLQNTLGDGGVGFVPFNNSAVISEGGSFGIGGGGVQKTNSSFDPLTDDIYDPTLYSVRYSAAASGYINVQMLNKVFRKADVFYLRKPGGGTFKWGDGSYAPGALAVNTDHTSKEVAMHSHTGTWPKSVTNIAQVSSVSGDVHVIGTNLWRNDVGGGVRVHRFAQGGTQTRQVAQLDGATYTFMLQKLGCDLFILNTGMNDSGVPISDIQYDTDVRTILTWVRNANPNAAIVLKIMNESDGVGGRNNVLESYRKKLLQIALDFDALIFDVRWILGSYANASAKGLMVDGVHPNAAANRLIGEALYRFIGGYALKNVAQMLI